MKKGFLLIQLGTPKSPSTKHVRRYLRQFLSDPLVIDIHPVKRWLLVNLIIAPIRSIFSARKYKKIWTSSGSPLTLHTEELVSRVRQKISEDYFVDFAMRYGEPSIEQVIKRFLDQGIEHIKVLPLYPQYASSTTQSSLNELDRVLKKIERKPLIEILPPFYGQEEFLEAWVKVGKTYVEGMKAQHILFSFHGLPESQIKSLDEFASCLSNQNCCDQITEKNKNCYRAHCFATARGIAQKLELPEENYTVTFQSRLGSVPWIKPYTDEVLEELAIAGVKTILVFSPSFVADCLETLEEIQIGEEKKFLKMGGERLTLVPSLNSNSAWVESVLKMMA